MTNVKPAQTPVRPVAPALAVAGLVGAFLLCQDMVQGATSAVATFAYGGLGAGFFGNGGLLQLGVGHLFFALAVAGGVFLSIWLLAPIVAELPLRQVVLRGVLGAAVATAVQLVLGLVGEIVGLFARAGSLFGNSFPDLGLGGWAGIAPLIGSVSGAVSVFMSLLPVVVLAGVLFWLWQRRRSGVAERQVGGTGLV